MEQSNKPAVITTYESIEDFQKFLNNDPPKSEIKKNERANNSEYIDIRLIERKLDEIFSGLWRTENFHWQVIANEIVANIDLYVMHPIAKVWINRTGAAAVQIQLRSKDKGGSGDITEIRDKITNTLQKDFPHLKAECLKNAAKSIGAYFGRNLNMKYEIDAYETFGEKVAEFDENRTECISLLETAKLGAETKTSIRKNIEASSGEKLRDIKKYLEGKQ